MICAMSGMQAVEPSVTGNSSSVRMGAAGTSLAEEAGASDEAALDAGALEAASPQAARLPRQRRVSRQSSKGFRSIKVPPFPLHWGNVKLLTMACTSSLHTDK